MKKIKAYIDDLEITMKMEKLNGMTFDGELYIYNIKQECFKVQKKGNAIPLIQFVDDEILDLNYILSPKTVYVV